MWVNLPPCWTEDDPEAPWNRQPGWQVAVATPHPLMFRLRRALAHIFRR